MKTVKLTEVTYPNSGEAASIPGQPSEADRAEAAANRAEAAEQSAGVHAESAEKSAATAKSEADRAKQEADRIAQATPKLATLTFTGAVNETYDGTKPVSVNIPEGGGEKAWVKIREETLKGETQGIECLNLDYDEIFVDFVDAMATYDTQLAVLVRTDKGREFQMETAGSQKMSLQKQKNRGTMHLVLHHMPDETACEGTCANVNAANAYGGSGPMVKANAGVAYNPWPAAGAKIKSIVVRAAAFAVASLTAGTYKIYGR